MELSHMQYLLFVLLSVREPGCREPGCHGGTVSHAIPVVCAIVGA